MYACLANYITDACMANCWGRARVHVLQYWCVLCILRHYVHMYIGWLNMVHARTMIYACTFTSVLC